MPRRIWMKLLHMFALGLVLVLISRYKTAPAATAIPSAVTPPVPLVLKGSATVTNAFVIRAVDGDTLEVRLDGISDPAKVRLLGINTPESVDPRKSVECFGKEASKHTAELVAGKRVRLEADPQADEVDKYGRLLRNVFLEDGTDFNAGPVKDGYAYAYLSFPLNKQRKMELSRLQSEAEAAKAGLWNPDTCNGKQ